MSTITTTESAAALNGNWHSHVLADYELHHSQPQPCETGTQSAPVPSPIDRQWDTQHRRVPAYRAINRNRDQSEVRVYTSPVERVFITVMFTGLNINAGAAQYWRASFGRLTDRVFRYQVGGEL
ncbi:hypothetical protein NCS57_01010800 [Fusarium keratoplasticum]|uniref:Uncharacterized protein n=1 Tax=Fusarium keratoplasticum TaxID=1328300 RepID=A0ACC0QPG7_9HYPO|nr:hypothetical protein NCS57_01010800 [Fusarium keratoplasticum]KAI8660339.1 hypothetical protein NCS57_01010800 [Fusarium keratoplasticum]